ncbi:MAG TPA: hypothetical protein DC063_06765 [Arenimonas sp.]|nr:MAG: hypothetical protein A2X76_09950 [Xanthomonadales bacterium GWF1_69_6]HBD19794.1 hypothetical protein [Arenimonas sp.]
MKLLSLAVLACALAALPAGVAAKKVAVKIETSSPTPDADAPFIAKSLVLAPERVAGFELRGATDYPGQPLLGVSLNYAHADLPEMTLHLFVYPIGRVTREQALAQVMREVREGIDMRLGQSLDGRVDYGEETSLDLGRVEEDGSLRPESAPAAVPPPAEGDENARVLAVFAQADDDLSPQRGRELPLQLAFDGRSMDSVAFAFYRGLYLFKGRATVNVGVVPAETLHRVARRAMAVLVPAIEVRNTGSCTKLEIQVDTKGSEDAMQEQLLRGMAASHLRGELENCAAELDATVPLGMRALPLEFPPGTWQQP